MRRVAQGCTHRLTTSVSSAAAVASRTAGAPTRQRLIPPAKQTTISCSVCSRFSATRSATKSAIGSTITSMAGMPSATILRNTQALWRWSTMMSSVASV